MGKADELNAEWKAVVEGMTFWGEPVQDMDADGLLSVIGYLVTENKRLQDAPGRRFEQAAQRGVIDLNVLWPQGAK
jgi:hypothetical protein